MTDRFVIEENHRESDYHTWFWCFDSKYRAYVAPDGQPGMNRAWESRDEVEDFVRRANVDPPMYRRFQTASVPSQGIFHIIERPPTDMQPEAEFLRLDKHDWTDHVTRQEAWNEARLQHLPVRVGGPGRFDPFKLLGVVFDPALFERAVYQGYVAYGRSMSDGYYAPIEFHPWVVGFRSQVRNWVWESDLSEPERLNNDYLFTTEALKLYSGMLANATALKEYQ